MNAGRQIAVVITKPSGKRVVFSVHGTERDAHSTVQRLRGFGLDVAAQHTRAGVLVPGMTVPAARSTR